MFSKIAEFPRFFFVLDGWRWLQPQFQEGSREVKSPNWREQSCAMRLTISWWLNDWKEFNTAFKRPDRSTDLPVSPLPPPPSSNLSEVCKVWIHVNNPVGQDQVVDRGGWEFNTAPLSATEKGLKQTHQITTRHLLWSQTERNKKYLRGSIVNWQVHSRRSGEVQH